LPNRRPVTCGKREQTTACLLDIDSLHFFSFSFLSIGRLEDVKSFVDYKPRKTLYLLKDGCDVEAENKFCLHKEWMRGYVFEDTEDLRLNTVEKMASILGKLL